MIRTHRFTTVGGVTLIVGLLSWLPLQAAEPKYYLPKVTLTQFVDQSEFVVTAILVETGEQSMGRLEIVADLKRNATSSSSIRAPIGSDDQVGDQFLVTATRNGNDPSFEWNIVRKVSESFAWHATELSQLKLNGARRLAYFQPFLEDSDVSIASNAHLEFVLADDQNFADVCRKLDPAKVRDWLRVKDIQEDRKRLYLAMLAQCGSAEDAERLKQQFTKQGFTNESELLDARIGCFLALTGESGLPLINQLYLGNPKAEFRDIYSAIMALRFVRDMPRRSIPKSALVQSFRKVLSNPAMADLVLIDLIQMQDWDSLDTVVELCKSSELPFGRVAFVNFVRACPQERAKLRLQELKELDPAAVKKATTFFPLPPDPSKRKNTTIRRHYGSKAVFQC